MSHIFNYKYCNLCQQSVKVHNNKEGLTSHLIYHHPLVFIKQLESTTAAILKPLPTSCFDCGETQVSQTLKRAYESKYALSKQHRDADLLQGTSNTGANHLEIIKVGKCEFCDSTKHRTVECTFLSCVLCGGSGHISIQCEIYKN